MRWAKASLPHPLYQIHGNMRWIHGEVWPAWRGSAGSLRWRGESAAASLRHGELDPWRGVGQLGEEQLARRRVGLGRGGGAAGVACPCEEPSA